MKKSFLTFAVLFVVAEAFYLSAQTMKPKPHADHVALIDINTATPEQLLVLPGMGRTYAQRIIAGRPYSAKNQLVSRGILPESAYEKIEEQIVARRVPGS